MGGAGGGGILGGYAGDIEGLDTLIGYDALNSLIVRGTSDAIAEVLEILSLIDLPPRQIQIETRYVTLTTNQANAFGFSWAIGNGEFATSSQSSYAGTHALRYAVGNFTGQIEALIRQSKGKVINAPTVAVQNGQPGMIMVGKTQPVFIPNIETNQFGIRTVEYEIEEFPAMTGLMVIARITGVPPKESITVYLSPQVQDFAGVVSSPDGQSTVPIITQQFVYTVLRVKDGETIAMGGLMRKNEDYEEEKVPLLGDLPFIGQLFRNHRKSNDTSELFIFVTPTIIRDEETEEVLEQARPVMAPP
jgi:type II secretory pathway component GspD/PulD (secretin)